MDHFVYQNGELYAEDIAVAELASRFGTPLYIYSRATLERHYRVFDQAFGQHAHLICYSVKANSNLAVLNLLARLGSGFDIVSQGELERVLLAGGKANKIVFSGVAKSSQEINRALEIGIRCFNVESPAELNRIEQLAAESGRVAPISIRVNPDVDAQTHPYISTGLRENKFGVDANTALKMYQQAANSKHLRVEGIDCHIGSQLTKAEPFVAALARIVDLANQLAKNGITIKHIDVGGGLGIRYRDETPPSPEAWVKYIVDALGDLPYEIQAEPGRVLVGNAGLLVTQVEYLKENCGKKFAVVDAGMNDLLRPALYQAWQEIIAVSQQDIAAHDYDVVGPVCESSDFLGKERNLAIQAGALLAVRSAGAYGFSMSSNYNSRPRPAEIMVDKDQAYIIRQRENIEHLVRGEQLLPD